MKALDFLLLGLKKGDRVRVRRVMDDAPVECVYVGLHSFGKGNLSEEWDVFPSFLSIGKNGGVRSISPFRFKDGSLAFNRCSFREIATIEPVEPLSEETLSNAANAYQALGSRALQDIGKLLRKRVADAISATHSGTSQDIFCALEEIFRRNGITWAELAADKGAAVGAAADVLILASAVKTDPHGGLHVSLNEELRKKIKVHLDPEGGSFYASLEQKHCNTTGDVIAVSITESGTPCFDVSTEYSLEKDQPLSCNASYGVYIEDVPYALKCILCAIRKPYTPEDDEIDN